MSERLVPTGINRHASARPRAASVRPPLQVRVLAPEESSRRLVAQALRRRAGLTVSAPSGAEVTSGLASKRVDVVVVQVDRRKDLALRIATTALREQPTCAVVLTGVPDDISFVIEALRIGVRGFLPEAQGLAELHTVLTLVAGGEYALPRRFLSTLLPRLLNLDEQDHGHERLALLTAQQRRVLHLLVQGADTREMAAALGISKETARTHLQHILQRWEVHSRLEAVALVQQLNLQDRLLPADPG